MTVGTTATPTTTAPGMQTVSFATLASKASDPNFWNGATVVSLFKGGRCFGVDVKPLGEVTDAKSVVVLYPDNAIPKAFDGAKDFVARDRAQPQLGVFIVRGSDLLPAAMTMPARPNR